MNRNLWLLACGLALLAWQPPLPRSEAGKAPEPPKVIVVKAKANVKIIRPKEFTKLPPTRPSGLSAAQKMQILKSGYGALPPLKAGSTLATKLRLTPHEPYQATGWLDFIDARTNNQSNTVRVPGGPAPKVTLYLEVPIGKRYLVEFGVQTTGSQTNEFTLLTDGETHKVGGARLTTIPVLLDIPESVASKADAETGSTAKTPERRRLNAARYFELSANAQWIFHYCEVTTLN